MLESTKITLFKSSKSTCFVPLDWLLLKAFDRVEFIKDSRRLLSSNLFFDLLWISRRVWRSWSLGCSITNTEIIFLSIIIYLFQRWFFVLGRIQLQAESTRCFCTLFGRWRRAKKHRYRKFKLEAYFSLSIFLGLGAFFLGDGDFGFISIWAWPFSSCLFYATLFYFNGLEIAS